jgi:ABC-type iron transport system FetAB ATPase subunit
MDEIDPIVVDARGAAQRKRAVLALDGLALATRAQGFSTRLRAGDVVQLEGPHAGLLIEVLAGMLGPASGQVLVSGRSATGLGQRQRRQWLGVAAPWAPLLQDGLEDNLLVRMRRGAGREELPGLLQAFHLAHLLDDQGQLLAQRLREEGDGLEPRDKAAIRLIRVLIGQPRLLLLDRSTRDLDAGQIAGLRGLLKGWPGVIVLAGESPEITALATRRWTVSGSHITETMPTSGEDRHVAAIHPLHPAGRA